MSVRIGYKASAEQFGPRQLLEFSLQAEAVGLEIVAISDHFQPWRHSGGHAPAAMSWLGAVGQSTKRVTLGTSVLTPTLRYHPSIVAQAFATLASLNPGRIFLGIGSGEAMNETPATGQEFPGRKERRRRLAEAVELIRLLWNQERVDFAGDYYEVSKATIYDRPAQPVPIYVAASGPLAAKLAGRVGNGFICTSGKDRALYRKLLDSLDEGAAEAGRDPSAIRRMIEVKVSYDRDPEQALQACRWWAALALSPEEKEGVEDPVDMERLADMHADRAHTRFIVSSDPDRVVDEIGAYLDLGFDDLVLHAPGGNQARFLEQFAEDVLPALRARAVTPRLRYITETLAWTGGIHPRSDDLVAEPAAHDDGRLVLGDIQRAGLVARDERGVRLTDLGCKVAAGFGEVVNRQHAPEHARRLRELARDVLPDMQADADILRLRYVAEVLVWIGGKATWSEDLEVERSGEDARSRIVRDLVAAEAAGLIERHDGGVKLTDRGWAGAEG